MFTRCASTLQCSSTVNEGRRTNGMEQNTASLEEIASALTTALGAVLDEDAFDVALGVSRESRELDVATDDWTLHFEGWPETIGWLAVDDEPDDKASYDSARRAVMSETVEQALGQADRATGGAITQALQRSNDPFTQAL